VSNNTLNHSELANGPSLSDRLYRFIGHSNVPYAPSLLSRLGALQPGTPRLFECSFFGFRYKGRLDHWIDRHVWLFGAYAPAELNFLSFAASVLRANVNRVSYFDIGANVGHHTLFMAAYADDVYAFEPSPEACSELRSKIKSNNLSHINIYEIALGDHDAAGLLGSGLPDNPGSRSLVWTLDAARDEVVQIRIGDFFMREIAAPKINLLKVDVEGFEKNVFAGLKDTLRRDRPIILFELIGKTDKSGFRSEQELREHLFTEHSLFAVRGERQAKLFPFIWGDDAVVCLPNELIAYFEPIMG
jgi:FkbM family methyltransferase